MRQMGVNGTPFVLRLAGPPGLTLMPSAWPLGLVDRLRSLRTDVRLIPMFDKERLTGITCIAYASPHGAFG